MSYQAEDAGHSVVVVNDDQTQLDILTHLLSGEGISASAFSDAGQALDYMLNQASPSLIITDLYMPGIDGWKLCRLLKSPEYRKLNHVPILVTSATFSGEDPAEISADLGASAFVPQPLDGKKFLEKVKSLLSGRLQSYCRSALIASADMGVVSAVKEAFEVRGCRVEPAYSIKAGIEKIADSRFDVAVIEQNLPDGRGEQLLTEISSRMPGCVCIAAARDPGPEDAMNWMKKGAAAYLKKPLDPRCLFEICVNTRRERAFIHARDLLEDRSRQLEQEKTRYRQIFSGIPDGALVHDPEGRILEANEAMADRLELTSGELTGRNIREFISPANASAMPENAGRVLKGRPQVFETTYISAGGKKIQAQVHERAVSWDGKQAILSISRDISLQRRAEESLQKSEDRFQKLIQHSNDIFVITDTDGIIKYASRSVERITGIPAEEYEGTGSLDHVHPADSGRLMHSMQELLKNPETPIRCEYRQRTAYGDWRWLEAIGTNFVKEPAIEGVVFNVRDVTERKRFYAENERLRRAIEQSGEIVIITDTGGAVQYVNPAFERITGYREEEIKGKTLEAVKSGEQDEQVYRELWKRISSGETWQGRLVNRRKDGSFYTVQASIFPVHDRAGSIVNFMSVQHDITKEIELNQEKDRIKEQFQQAQKLESIGRLASGIAHDLNNLLSPILGYGEMLAEELPGHSAQKYSAEEIVQAGMRARDLVHQLLAFSRKQIMEFKAIDLNSLVSRFQKLLRRTIREDVVIRLNLAETLPAVSGDPGQLEQVIMNMAVNAQDAMPEGGTITIETGLTRLDQEYAAEHQGVTPGFYVMLSFNDTGTGMDKDDCSRIFEPFFSTKGEKGTGLGLATVYGIVKQHGGNIWVYSEPGQGTTFKVYLPAGGDPCGDVKKERSRPAGFKGTETIVLVEDNHQVRRLARTVLEKYGYQVLEFENPDKALSEIENYRSSIQLLLTDVVMPCMDGRRLFMQMAEKIPGLEAIFMSGHTEHVVSERGILDRNVNYIQKPFSVKELAKKVREVLDKTKSANDAGTADDQKT